MHTHACNTHTHAHTHLHTHTCTHTHICTHRHSKPFNPLLGETYELVSKDSNYCVVSEQVSHHPPITALHAESDKWVFWEEYKLDIKFRGQVRSQSMSSACAASDVIGSGVVTEECTLHTVLLHFKPGIFTRFDGNWCQSMCVCMITFTVVRRHVVLIVHGYILR